MHSTIISLLRSLKVPELKPLPSHRNTQRLFTYLQKEGRALARDLFNLPLSEWRRELGEETDLSFNWGAEMDATRHAFGNDKAWHGKQARCFMHYILSPDPKDHMTLDQLRELATSWAIRFFSDYEVAIVYHDDNANEILHAHIVVNNTNLTSGNRLQIPNKYELNRTLQSMAKKRSLHAFSNKMPDQDKPHTLQTYYYGKQEKERIKRGDYSWVQDIRSRVTIAKNTTRTEDDFRAVLKELGVAITDNSPKAPRQDWIFSLEDTPTHKVSGERLGYTFGKVSLQDRFQRQAGYHPARATERALRKSARAAYAINNIKDLIYLAKRH